MQTNSERPLMYAIRCWLATVVLGALIVWFAISVADVIAINKSIYKELPSDCVSELGAKYDSFSHFYSNTRRGADAAKGKEDAAKFAKIKYKRLYKYVNEINTSTHRTELTEKYDQAYMNQFIAPHEEAINAEVEKWKQFLIENDPTPYLNVTVHTGNSNQANGWWGCPDWYFSVEEPKGELSDATVTFRVLNSNGYVRVETTYTLAELKENNGEPHVQYYKVQDPSFWKTHTPEIIVNSITQGDKTLTDDAIKQVPASVRAYNANPSKENKINLVRELLDTNCPEHDKWVKNAVEEQLKDADELCYEFSLKYMP